MYVCKNVHQFELYGGRFSYQQPVNVMRFSQNGKYLAIGFDDGLLVILDTKLLPWKTARVYKAGATIRGLVWHPTIPTALVIGSGNGDINKLRFVEDDELALNDFTGLEHVTNFVHAIAINMDASQVVVAYGQKIAFVDTALGFEKSWKVTPSNSIRTSFRRGPESRVLTVGDIHYIDNQTIIVCFVDAGAPFIAYSTVSPYQVRWTMKGQEGPDTWMGRSAISPCNKSGIKLLAITNLHDGIDWYCLYRKRYMMTTRYKLGLNVVVDIEFIDDMTVIVGQGTGEAIIATFGMAKDPSGYTIGYGTWPVEIRRLCGLRLVHKDRQLVMAAAVSDDHGDTIIGLAAVCVDENVKGFALQSQAVRDQTQAAGLNNDDVCGDANSVALVLEAPGAVEDVDNQCDDRAAVTEHAALRTAAEGEDDSSMQTPPEVQGKSAAERGDVSTCGGGADGVVLPEASRTTEVTRSTFQDIVPFLFVLIILALELSPLQATDFSRWVL
ncbi:hypothetical protein BD779DRAFT_1675975 [Infundibulicybe gibba]|nr:hypothetical protein BD779DRAFT_1675975 [Infundibulicybe gibba]